MMNALYPIVTLLNAVEVLLRTVGVCLVLVVLGLPRWDGSV